MPKPALAALALALCLALAVPGRAAPPLTHQRLESSGVRWLPAKTVWSTDQVLQQRRQQLLDPGRRAAAMNELREKPGVAGPQLRKAMYHALRSTMQSDLPAAQRATLCQQLTRQFGEFARQVRREPNMPVKERVAFGRVYVRFLHDGVLMQELAREREQQYKFKTALSLSGLAARTPRAAKQSATAPPKIVWQIPDPVDKAQLKSLPTRATTYSLSKYKTDTAAAVQSYQRQARRWRLVQSHTFSPGFVAKQKQAMDKEQAHLEQVTRRMVQSVPRVTESKLLRAFVWPQSPVRVQRVVDNPKAVQVVDNSLQWKLNQKGLELRPAGNRLQLEATFETTIKNPAVLQAFKRSIETVWNGPVRIKGGASKQLRTRVKFRRVSSESQFSEGSLRLVEGAKNCANQNVIHLARSFSGVTPAHEFGHILGLRDTYKTLYDPRGRAFVEVQDRTTLMGSHKAPATCNTMTRACNNLLQR